MAQVPMDRVAAIFRCYDVRVLGVLTRSDAIAALSDLGSMHGVTASTIGEQQLQLAAGAKRR